MQQTQIGFGALTDEQLALVLATQNTEVNQLRLADAYYEWLLSKKNTFPLTTNDIVNQYNTTQ